MALISKTLAAEIGCITLNNDARRNVLGETAMQEISTALEEFAQAKARAVILRANPGVKIWSAGHDVEELPETGRDPLHWAEPLRRLVRSIESFPAPIIALVEGSVWGGACEVVLACDLIIATPDATLAATPARLGVPYNPTGLMTYLNVVPFHIAKEMLFTANPLTAAHLAQSGVVNHVVAADEITAFCQQMAVNITCNAPLSVAVMKEQLRLFAGARGLSPEALERIQGLRREVYSSADYEEGKRALLEKRKPVFRGQ